MAENATPEPPAAEPSPATERYGFDWHEDYCSSPVEDVLSDLKAEIPERHHAFLVANTTSDNDAAHTLLLAYAQELRLSEEEDDDVASDIEEAAARLTWCEHSCECASNAWYFEADNINHALTAFADGPYATTSTRNGRYRTDDLIEDWYELDLSKMLESISGHRGEWTDMTLEITDTELVLTADRASLTLRTLTPEQEKLYRQLEDLAGGEMLAGVVATYPALAAFAARFLQVLEEAGQPTRDSLWWDADDLIDHLLKAGDVTGIDPAVAAQLVEHLTSIEEVITAARAVAAPAAA